MPLHCFSPFFPYFLLWELHHTALTTQSAISRTNFRLFVALFGPLAQCHIKCKDLIDTGIFHGEITSQEAAFFITFLTFFTLLDLINHLKQQQQPKKHRQSQNLCKRTGPSLRTLWCGG